MRTASIMFCFFPFLLCSLTAKEQTAPKPKNSILKDSTFIKLADDYGYFSKTFDSAIAGGHPDTDAIQAFMDQFDSAGNLKGEKPEIPVRKDKTSGWRPAQGEYHDIFVKQTSPASGSDYYEAIAIKPAEAKTLHLTVEASLFSSNIFALVHQPFYIQVNSKATLFLNKLFQGKCILNVALPSTDSIAIFFIAHPPADDKTHFSYTWVIGDTAELSYQGKKPEEVFDRMLELARFGFMNVEADHEGTVSDIEYREGLFATLPAERNFFSNQVEQYTGKNIETGKDADLLTAAWNKQISGWLKDYDVTDIVKVEAGDRKLNTDTELTTYTKKNAAGQPLFKVTVFKEQDGEGTELEPVWWNTGVRISKE